MDSGGDQSKQDKGKSPMSGGDQSGRYKGKSPILPKEITIPFRVFSHQENPRAEIALKLARPFNPDRDKATVPDKDYPRVKIETMSVENHHALHIMHNLNHDNIVSMKACGKTNLDNDNELSMFMEEDLQLLTFDHLWNLAFDAFNHIPSQTFQKIISEIIDGVDYLWRNYQYHGNLNWETTRFTKSHTVKLYGFKRKDLPLKEAQWQDCEAIINMLEMIIAKAALQNAIYPMMRNYFYDEVNELINTMRASNRNYILELRDTVHDEVFFWTTGIRTKFAMVTVFKYLSNQKFIDKVEESDFCCVPWNSVGKETIDTYFERLLKHCNDFREAQTPSLPKFDVGLKIDCVKFVYAAYTHRSQIQGDLRFGVDYVVRAIFPKLFIELKRIIKNL